VNKYIRVVQAYEEPSHLPRNFWGKTPKKNVLSLFKKDFTPAKSKKQETFFFGVAERSEAVAERCERTIQSRATTRSACAISRHQGCFQNTLELCLIHTAHKKISILMDIFLLRLK